MKFTGKGTRTIELTLQTMIDEHTMTNLQLFRYDAAADEWLLQPDRLIEPRFFHTVIEVPESFCDYF